MPNTYIKFTVLTALAVLLGACSTRAGKTSAATAPTPTPAPQTSSNGRLAEGIPLMDAATAKVFTPGPLQPGLLPGGKTLRYVNAGMRAAGGHHMPQAASSYAVGVLDLALYNVLVAARVSVPGYTDREAMLVARHKTDLGGTPVAEMFRGVRLRKENGTALVEILAANGGPLKATIAQQFDTGQILSSTAVTSDKGVLTLVAFNGTLAAYWEGEIAGIVEDPNPSEAPGYFGFQALTSEMSDLPDFGEMVAANLDPVAAASPLTLFEDAFDKGDGQNLRSPWYTVQGQIQISKGGIVANAGTPSVSTILAGNPDAKNRSAAIRNVSVSATVDFSAGSGSGARAGVVVREILDTATSTPRYLNAFLRRTSAGTYEAAVEVVRNGTATAVGTPVPAPHFSGSGTLQVRAVDRTLKVFVDGEYLLSVDVPTTTEFPQSGAFGILLQDSRANDFRATVVR